MSDSTAFRHMYEELKVIHRNLGKDSSARRQDPKAIRSKVNKINKLNADFKDIRDNYNKHEHNDALKKEVKEYVELILKFFDLINRILESRLKKVADLREITDVNDSDLELDSLEIINSNLRVKMGEKFSLRTAASLLPLMDELDIPITGIESIFQKISKRNLTYIIGCVYRAPDSNINDDISLFKALSDLFTSHDKVFVFDDFNMPGLTWPLNVSQSSNPSYQLLIDMILGTHLSQLVTQPTRYRINQQPSTLDLILTSDNNLFANLQYLGFIEKSDHIILKVDLQICFTSQRRVSTSQKTFIHFEAINQFLLTLDWSELLSNSSVENNGSTFKTRLNNIVSEYSSTARITYEKRIADDKNPKSFFKYIRSSLGAPVRKPQVRNTDGCVVDDESLVADIFASTFAAAFTNEPNSIPVMNVPSNVARLNDLQFLEETVLEKLVKLKSTKSPGPDKITAKILKSCATDLSRPICILIN
ncbi:hypothetical protein Zmor_003845 [Zophobas morio]|uniref:Endonuclease/exonuclease/phosphatase domain-containing protein n=1 Tax=Zophobas morio TaxID=2755281 RepID=A0AA38M308_9CUCU|nr:hypothetical protein Zmor_003845 [Zophobas morio]